MADKEKQYILEYNSNKNGYNLDCGGGVQKKVYQYSIPEGILLNSFDSLENAANALNAKRKSISNVCLGYNKTYRGFYWSYTLTEPFVPNVDQRKKEVGQHFLDGELVAIYSSVSEASRKTGISKTCIARCCRGERKDSGGFLWKYI
jgi:hypothetical protein